MRVWAGTTVHITMPGSQLDSFLLPVVMCVVGCLYLSGFYLLQLSIIGDMERELLAKLYLGWEILNDFHQILATLCKGLIYRVSFQASLEGNVKDS